MRLLNASTKEKGVSRLGSRNARVIGWEPLGRYGVVGVPTVG
jgi:hypothetical protein